MQPKHLIRYVPEPVYAYPASIPATISALFYIEHRTEIYGWYAQARRAQYNAAFFVVEEFYTAHAPALLRSVEDDVYGPWRSEKPLSQQRIRCPVPEPLRHELERLQSAFIDEWLFFPSDPLHRPEVERYQARGLALHAFNIKSRRLNRLDDRLPVWRHESAGSNAEVIDFLQKNWRFYGKELFLDMEVSPRHAFRSYDEVDISSTKKGRH